MVLEIDNLRVAIRTDRKTEDGHPVFVYPVDGIHLAIARGQTLCLVGESGCGKSMTALAIMGLLPLNARAKGSVRFHGTDLLTEKADAVRKLRGDRVAMIFQEPMTALHPSQTIGDQLAEVCIVHERMGRVAARAVALQRLQDVHMPDPKDVLHKYAHQLSGGQCQRVLIAMALMGHPELLIADEPTTALDVCVQAQVLDLLRELQAKHGLAILLITHDMGIVAKVADDVAVMYAGRIVERAPVAELFRDPKHPYTTGLLASVPELGNCDRPLTGIDGHPPRLEDLVELSGCRFAERCTAAWMDSTRCVGTYPPTKELAPGRAYNCIQ
ncbi:MAG: ABC transporter ATP-binding protein [bacterium]|nr:ABC transporter ATP-binding protein [bacterium]